MIAKFWSDYNHYLVQLEFNFGFNGSTPLSYRKIQDYQSIGKRLQTPMTKSNFMQFTRFMERNSCPNLHEKENGTTRFYFANTFLRFELRFCFITGIFLHLLTVEIKLLFRSIRLALRMGTELKVPFSNALHLLCLRNIAGFQELETSLVHLSK